MIRRQLVEARIKQDEENDRVPTQGEGDKLLQGGTVALITVALFFRR